MVRIANMVVRRLQTEAAFLLSRNGTDDPQDRNSRPTGDGV
jgi:hypothetical protein